MVSNWTNYEYLVFGIAIVKGPDMAITVRINDGKRMHRYADHFIVKIIATNEYKLVRIHLAEMVSESDLSDVDLTDIQELVIFARDKRNGSKMVLTDIHLE